MSFDPLQELQTLPQFDFINASRFQPWIDRVNSIDPGRLPWHVRRLSGFGGSEIGVLVGALQGDFHPHSSATSLVATKLLQVLPEEPNGDLLRGQEMEEPARVMYRKQILKTHPAAKPRDDIINHLGKFRDSERPWVIGTPDEVIEMEPGKIWIVDYKCPNPTALQEYKRSGVPFYYAAQLHHYRYIAQKMGYQIAGLQLASLDYKEWNMYLQDVPFDPVLEEQCLYAGDHYWNNHVMKGIVPPKDGVKRYGDAADLHDNLIEGAVLYTLYSTISNTLEKTKENIHQVLKESGASLDSSLDSIPLGLVDIKAQRDFDIDAMHQELQKHSIPTSLYSSQSGFDSEKMLNFIVNQLNITNENDARLDPFKTPKIFDPKKMVEQCRKLGLDIAPFITKEEIKMQLSRSMDPYASHMKKSLQSIVKKAAPEFIENLREQMQSAELDYTSAEIEKMASRHPKRKI